MMLMSSSIFVPAVEIRADKTPNPEPQTVAFHNISSTWLIGLPPQVCFGFRLSQPQHRKYIKFSLDKLKKLADWCWCWYWGTGYWVLGGVFGLASTLAETSGISQTGN